MKTRNIVTHAIVALFVLLILLLLVGQLLGQPVLVFVETGSMEPTLEPGDGYVAVPAMFAGEIEEGDVILFDAQELGGGELTTHRVDTVTEDGYITKGDANPFTDQENDEPPVQEGQIQSIALQVNGDLVVIPNLGGGVESVTSVTDIVQVRLFTAVGLEPPGTSAFATGILVTGLTLLILSSLDGFAGERGRDRVRSNPLEKGLVIIVILALLVIIPLNLAMLLPSGVYQYEIESSSAPTDDEQLIEAGETGEVTYTMQNGGQLPVVVILEPAGEGVEVSEESHYLSRQSTENTSVTMSAPEEPGTYYRFVQETRYVALLPSTVIIFLHSVHPLLSLAVINLVAAVPIVVAGLLTLGTDRIRLRSRSRDTSSVGSIRRRLEAFLPGGSTSGASESKRGLSIGEGIRNWVRTDDREGPRSESRPPPVRSGKSAETTVTEAGEISVETNPSESNDDSSDMPFDVPDKDPTELSFTDLDDDSSESADDGPVEDPSKRADEEPDERSESSFDGPDYQIKLVKELISDSPEKQGRAAQVWTPTLLCEYLNETYDTSFSLDDCRTLMIEAGSEGVRTARVDVDTSTDSEESSAPTPPTDDRDE